MKLNQLSVQLAVASLALGNLSVAVAGSSLKKTVNVNQQKTGFFGNTTFVMNTASGDLSVVRTSVSQLQFVGSEGLVAYAEKSVGSSAITLFDEDHNKIASLTVEKDEETSEPYLSYRNAQGEEIAKGARSLENKQTMYKFLDTNDESVELARLETVDGKNSQFLLTTNNDSPLDSKMFAARALFDRLSSKRKNTGIVAAASAAIATVGGILVVKSVTKKSPAQPKSTEILLLKPSTDSSASTTSASSSASASTLTSNPSDESEKATEVKPSSKGSVEIETEDGDENENGSIAHGKKIQRLKDSRDAALAIHNSMIAVHANYVAQVKAASADVQTVTKEISDNEALIRSLQNGQQNDKGNVRRGKKDEKFKARLQAYEERKAERDAKINDLTRKNAEFAKVLSNSKKLEEEANKNLQGAISGLVVTSKNLEDAEAALNL